NDFRKCVKSKHQFHNYRNGGRIAEIVGPRKVYGCTILVSSIISLFIPMASHASPIAVIVLRILMGPSFPSAHAILANWAPPQERSFLSSILYAGKYF
ncbi:Vesicular glutamate transporter 2, partial [Armadillidium vulgare]